MSRFKEALAILRARQMTARQRLRVAFSEQLSRLEPSDVEDANVRALLEALPLFGADRARMHGALDALSEADTERLVDKILALSGDVVPPRKPMARWRAWTDGACEPNPGPAGVGFVLLSHDGTRYEGYQGLGKATNNVAELTAILRVAEIVPRDRAITIYTDSRYAIGVLARGWRASANTELVEETRRALLRHVSFELEWVKGHRDNLENNVADRLSTLGGASQPMAEACVRAVTLALSEIAADLARSRSSGD